MSYNLFLLLNPNHEVEPLLAFIAARLERTGPTSFCYDQSPDIFFTAEYLKEGSDTSVLIDVPFGAENDVIRSVLNFMTDFQQYVQFQVLDPQIGKVIEVKQTKELIDSWSKSNRKALENYRDGHYFLRTIEWRSGKKVMIEAIRFQEETWQNHCSVGMAWNRIQDAEQALSHFLRARELDPNNPAIWHALGVTLFNLQKFAEAKDILGEYLESDPENALAKELFGICASKNQ